MRPPSRGLGDLRNISRKPWSKSADDLGKLSSAPALSRIDTSFQNKVNDYRVNTIPSDATPTSHSPDSITYPFPSITTTNAEAETPSSSPPQRSDILTASSSPAGTNTPPLTPNGHIHSRSHSFTPRLPSKLSSPKLGLAQPSPKRKGSAPSPSDAEPPKDSKSTAGSLSSGSSTRAGFPFGFGGSAGSGSKAASPLNSEIPSPLDKPGVSSNLLAPPTIVEPGDNDESKSEKRTSQLIYHSGFINRLTDFSPATLNARAAQAMPGGLLFSKGWKPFKLVLRGSKLYFYKPPSDRGAAVKELFPTELVVVLEEEGVADQIPEPKEELFGTPRVAKSGDRDENRRKRTFWGSSTHPALTTGARGVESGTFEALLHEAVFGTTFTAAPTDGVGKEKTTSSQWQTFALAMIYALPSAIGRGQFEPELRRCCTMLVDSTSDPENARKKVQWIVEQYLTFYASPVDPTTWESWRQSTIPDFPSKFVPSSKPSGLPSSSSTQAIFAPTPEIASAGQQSDSFKSPNVGTFSPRPGDDDRMISLINALGDTSGAILKPLQVPEPTVKPWHVALENGGLTRELLLGLDAQLIARSLFVFNQRALKQVPDVVTANVCLAAELDAEADEHDSHSPVTAFLPFIGCEEHPHWLTKLVLLQVLISDSPSSSQSQHGTLHGRPTDAHHGPPRTYSRSEVIAGWARIGELSRRTGDECSWKAIQAALCSRPLARLDKVWKRVDHDALRLVRSWVYSHDGGEGASVTDAKHIPWVGDHIAHVKDSLELAHSSGGVEWKVTPLVHAWHSFEALKRDFALVSRAAIDDVSEEPEDVEILVKLWQKVSQQGNTVPGIAAKFKRYLYLFVLPPFDDTHMRLVLTNSCLSPWLPNPSAGACSSLTIGHALNTLSTH